MKLSQDIIVYGQRSRLDHVQNLNEISKFSFEFVPVNDFSEVETHIQSQNSLESLVVMLDSSVLPERVADIQSATSSLDTIVLVDTTEPELATAGLAAGAIDYLIKPLDSGVVNEMLRRLVLARDQSHIVAEDPATKRTFHLASRVAQVDASVLLQGESGVGKEVVASYIHEHSSRSTQPFVAVNCAAIPESIAESVLFGHVKGAFTGADSSQSGKFEEANGGTIFLDEVSELPLPIQAKLLRVLQEREVERLGSHKKVALDVRVLAASNISLEAQITAGSFRKDLFYRLAVLELGVPALRDRPRDIEPLALALLTHLSGGACSMTPAFIKALQSYDWPGNVRELHNMINRTFTFRRGNCLDVLDLELSGFDLPGGLSIVEQQGDVSHELSALGRISSIRKRAEYELILDVLKQSNGVRKEAANQLGISTRALRYKINAMKDAGIDVELVLKEAA